MPNVRKSILTAGLYGGSINAQSLCERMTDPSVDIALWRRLELPTWAVAVAIYASWFALTWWHASLPV